MTLARAGAQRQTVDAFEVQPIALCGRQLVAFRCGALYWPAQRALIVADLHLEKGSSFAARGRMVPPYDTRETLIRLAEILERTEARLVIALGDSLHDAGAGDRIDRADLDVLALLQEDRRWIWIHGNHDPSIAPALGGERMQELGLDGLTFRHVPRPGHVTHEVAGHLHPAARLSMHGALIRRPCFVANGRRMVLPAFGAFTGGLNVLDTAFEPVFGSDGLAVWMLGQEGVYPVAARQLRPD